MDTTFGLSWHRIYLFIYFSALSTQAWPYATDMEGNVIHLFSLVTEKQSRKLFSVFLSVQNQVSP